LERVAIFEVGRIYYKVAKPSAETGETGVEEPRHLSMLLTGPRHGLTWQEDVNQGQLDYFDLKGIVDALLQQLFLAHKAVWARGTHPTFHPGRCAEVSVDGRVLGVMGEIHPLVCEAFDLPDQPVLGLEWDLDVLLDAAEVADEEKQVGLFSPYAPVHEDMAVVVDEATQAVDVRRTLLEAGYPLVSEVVLFDVYRGEQVGPGKKSLAFSLSYQAPNRSLSDRDVGKLRKRLIKALAKDLDAKLRGQ
jgi:phenylalanyl-tRNA synthetase beta chain